MCRRRESRTHQRRKREAGSPRRSWHLETRTLPATARCSHKERSSSRRRSRRGTNPSRSTRRISRWTAIYALHHRSPNAKHARETRPLAAFAAVLSPPGHRTGPHRVRTRTISSVGATAPCSCPDELGPGAVRRLGEGVDGTVAGWASAHRRRVAFCQRLLTRNPPNYAQSPSWPLTSRRVRRYNGGPAHRVCSRPARIRARGLISHPSRMREGDREDQVPRSHPSVPGGSCSLSTHPCVAFPLFPGLASARPRGPRDRAGRPRALKTRAPVSVSSASLRRSRSFREVAA